MTALHRFLDGSADDVDPAVQRAWIIGRICEEFPGCLPSAAERELERDPDQLVLEIMDLRGYARAKTAFDHAVDKVDDLKGWTGNKHMTIVETITFEERQRRRQTSTEGRG